MRSLCLLAALCSPLAMAQSINVQPNSFMRLPGNNSVLQLDRLEVADGATLWVPAAVTEMNVGELKLGREARITIVPGPTPFKLAVKQGELGSGSQISARGAAGSFEKPALPGRNLTLRLERLKADILAVDARGGTGAPGYSGLDGGNGKAPGCTWGQAGKGSDGDKGGDGREGAAGGQVRLEVPLEFTAEHIKVQVDGGAGGAPGVGGKGGQGGASKGCLVYRADGGKAGRTGDAGQPGGKGSAGSVTVQHL